MSIGNKASAFDAIRFAIKAELDFIELYTKLESRAKNKDVKDKIKYLKSEEQKHQKLFVNLFAKQFPGQELIIPDESFVPILRSLATASSVTELLELAMEGEQKAAEFYADLANRSKDKTARTILTYLNNMENSHYYLLKADHELLEAMPDYSEIEELLQADWNLAL